MSSYWNLLKFQKLKVSQYQMFSFDFQLFGEGRERKNKKNNK